LSQRLADVVMLLGARLDWTFRYGSEIGPDAKIIQIDVHESELGRNRVPAVAILADVALALRRILTRMTQAAERFSGRTLSLWHRQLSAERSRKRERIDEESARSTWPMSPQQMYREIRSFLPRDAICVLDGNVSMAVGQQLLPAYAPASRFTAGSNGCMGVGIPFAIGAKLARPDRMVVAVCGDMGFAQSAMDMETAVRHRIPIVAVVVNNDGGTGALMQKTFFPGAEERITMFQPDTRYEAIMRAIGGYAEYVDQPEQLIPALKRAAASGKAACINVKVNPDTPLPQE
jgi:thiamine pyrophosphate-dependent acetolactate synthase large subunit-like protein